MRFLLVTSLLLLIQGASSFATKVEASSRQAYSVASRRSSSFSPLAPSKTPLTRSTTALDQSSVSLPNPLGGSFFRRIRTLLPIRGGGSAPTTTTQESFLKRHPFASAVCITTVNAVLADLVTQLLTSGWNPKRSLVFAIFGCLYQGMVQYAIVNGLWERVFPGTSAKSVVAKICAMNLLSDPLLFMPTFYIFQQAMTTSTLTWATVHSALLAYKANCLVDWRNSWMVWFPGHAVTYGVMPKHKRIPWMAALSFFYMCILSLTRGGGI